VLAELRAPRNLPVLDLQPLPPRLARLAAAPDSKRMPWAELGGPERSLEWARRALGMRQGDPVAVQQRSWNLSTLWRLESSDGAGTVAWLKQVPHFLGCEGPLLRWLHGAVPGAAPEPLATDGEGRSLLAHVGGHDLYDAAAGLRGLVRERLHDIQLASVDAVEELIALGVPDQRGPKLTAYIQDKLEPHATETAGMPALFAKLEAHVTRLAECALPDVLLHVDNHPGNARGDARGVVLVDWGGAVVGNPVQDIVSLTAGLPPGEAAPVIADWCRAWKLRAPGCQPERALELFPYVSSLYGAALYAQFLQEIEASEWPYHADDVPRCLLAAENAWRCPA